MQLMLEGGVRGSSTSHVIKKVGTQYKYLYFTPKSYKTANHHTKMYAILEMFC